MKSNVFLSLFLFNLKLSLCFANAILYINTQSNDSFNQNDPQSGMTIFSINIEGNKDIEVNNGLKKVPKFRDDYTLYPGYGYYKYHIDQALWVNAKYICELEGAHLAVINSQSEADLINMIFNSYPRSSVQHPDYVLLGFHDRHAEGQFVTVLGGSLQDTGFTKWGKGQPDNAGGNENCGSLHKIGILNDFPCHVPANFMCEKEL